MEFLFLLLFIFIILLLISILMNLADYHDDVLDLEKELRKKGEL